MKFILISLIKFYSRIISPLWHGLMGPQAGCRFTPTCAHYGIEAIQTHGALKGGVMAINRVCRCHPWNNGGYDPVPPPSPKKKT